MMKQLNQIVSPLLSWYDTAARDLPWRKSADPYQIWISEIMLQQTRVEAVIPYYERFIEEFPTVFQLADADEERLLKRWEGLGYYSRARNLQKAARIIVSEYGGCLPPDLKALKSLPGIGEYTAGAIASIAFGIPAAAVDGNVLRVVSRVLAQKEDILSPKVKKEISSWITEIIPADRTGDFTQSLMELGAVICLPNGTPLCKKCPLAFCCQAYNMDLTGEIPLKREKAKRKIEKKTVFVLFYNHKLALRKREEKGVLSGLWEFPNTTGWLSETEIQNQLKEWEITPLQIEKEKEASHIFTHIEWKMSYYFITVQQESSQFQWITKKELEERCTLPNAFKHYETKIKKKLSK